MIAETLGRLPHRSATAVREVEQALRPWLAQPGTFRGIEALIRFNRKLQPPEAATINALRTAATLVADPAGAGGSSVRAQPDQSSVRPLPDQSSVRPLPDQSSVRLQPDQQTIIRRLAWLGVNAAAAADLPLIKRGAADPDPHVRRHVVEAIGTVMMTAMERRDWLLSALKDPSFNVRVEAVRVYARTLQATDCVPLIGATDDSNLHVAVEAIDALGSGCMAGPNPRARLLVLADSLPVAASGRWHAAAHALVALARTSREEAVPRLAKFAEHPSPFVRAYAARAAGIVGAVPRLERLAADPSDNVRYDALLALRQVRGHDADAWFIEALGRNDYQLVRAAAQALEGSANVARVVPALVQAFRRLSDERRETSRDSRLALLARLRELGSAEHAQALQGCLSDIDPMVAAECSATLEKWTGVRRTPRPAPVRPQPITEPLPSRARVLLRGGRAFELALLAEEAPASVFRFAVLARAGYYNGLTFHRVLPNFIIQGGSPGANEYSGDGAFMRDEISARTHARGTVGVSTRGRDTGDAQLFVNLLDNPRLDRDYTVFAEVTSGMDVVDAVLEGDVIDRVEILAAPAAAR
jgi:cyclophilin family peptidyl-prolyl cis-trans isomerase/HEAT repeat protein